MTEHQLDDANIDSVGQQPARPFVTEVVPVQVDLFEPVAIDPDPGLGSLRRMPVSDQLQ